MTLHNGQQDPAYSTEIVAVSQQREVQGQSASHQHILLSPDYKPQSWTQGHSNARGALCQEPSVRNPEGNQLTGKCTVVLGGNSSWLPFACVTLSPFKKDQPGYLPICLGGVWEHLSERAVWHREGVCVWGAVISWPTGGLTSQWQGSQRPRGHRCSTGQHLCCAEWLMGCLAAYLTIIARNWARFYA